MTAKEFIEKEALEYKLLEYDEGAYPVWQTLEIIKLPNYG